MPDMLYTDSGNALLGRLLPSGIVSGMTMNASA